MKALTLYQPWATLVAFGAKRNETRSWSTVYRGPLAIYAGKNVEYIRGRSKYYICDEHSFDTVLRKAGYFSEDTPFPGKLPLGCIVATCELVGCQLIEKSDLPLLSSQEIAFGLYTIGRYMWFLHNVKMLPEPIPAKGAMGLWEWKNNE